ncbi:hypothetical protein D6827_00795, partial [Candidatus Parcubacteria bacterium]
AIIVLSFISITSWGGFFVYQKYFQNQNNEYFLISLDTPEEKISGETTDITILYSNPTNIPIASLTIDLNVPSGFLINNFSKEPTDPEKLIWQIGTLPANSNDSITISGIWLASVPSQTPIQAYANFRPSNFNSEFEKIATAYITTDKSALSIKLEGDEEGTPGEINNYTITLTNDSNFTWQNAQITLDLPDGFYLENSEPPLTSHDGEPPVWTIDSIESKEITEIKFSGSFAGDIEDFQYFTANLYLIKGREKIQLAEAQTFTDIVPSGANIKLVANGNSDIATVNPDDKLRVALSYTNTSDTEIDDAKLLLDFQSNESLPINWSDASLDGGVITRDGIIWNPDTIGIIQSQESKLLNLVFPIDFGINDGDTFKLVASATYNNTTIKSSPITIKINSDISLKAEARYYNQQGEKLGNGPLPPIVGESTTYKIYWRLDNSIHDLENIIVKATLPPTAQWSQQKSTDLGDISFNQETNEVTWKIKNLPSESSDITASFAVTITPEDNDINSFVKLLSSTKLTATDTETNAQLTSATNSLTTDLITDEYAQDKGLVQSAD